MKLTLQTLIDKRACKDQVALFREMFGDSVEITEELCASSARKFDFTWAAQHLLSVAAWDDYLRITGWAWVDYVHITDDRIKGSARADYAHSRAITFAKLYNEEKVT